MHFLKQLFSGNEQVSSQVKKAGAKNQEKVMLNASQHLPTSSHNIQKKIEEKYLKKEVPQ